MGLDVELPSLETELNDSELTQDDSLTIENTNSFDIVLLHLPEQPKVKMKRKSLIDSVHNLDEHCCLISFTEDEVSIFHIKDAEILAYSGTKSDGIHFVSSALLCEDWIVLTYDISITMDNELQQFISEMELPKKTVFENGEVYIHLYQTNKLKRRIVSLKEMDSELFSP